MSAIEFVLIAYAIVIGMALAEILRGFADLIRAESLKLDARLLCFASWVLFIVLQVFWAMWRVEQRESWTFPQFLLFLLPAVLLYVIARISFPLEMKDSHLGEYYDRVSPTLWALTAATYLSFAALSSSLLYDSVQVPLLASQLGLAALALAATWLRANAFHFAILAAMLAQLVWRGFLVVVA